MGKTKLRFCDEIHSCFWPKLIIWSQKSKVKSYQICNLIVFSFWSTSLVLKLIPIVGKYSVSKSSSIYLLHSISALSSAKCGNILAVDMEKINQNKPNNAKFQGDVSCLYSVLYSSKYFLRLVFIMKINVVFAIIFHEFIEWKIIQIQFQVE